jgi:hypothetical protein
MPISDTRKEVLTGTVFERVVYPDMVYLQWPPTNWNDGTIYWKFKEWIEVDGVPQNKESLLTGHTTRLFGDVKTVQPAYAGLVDPHTGADLTQVSMHGVFLILQDAFDRAYEQDATP